MSEIKEYTEKMFEDIKHIDENVQKNYFISSTVVDNIEIKEFGYNFKLYPELYLNDVDQTTCSNEFMDRIKDSKDDDIVFAKRTYDFD